MKRVKELFKIILVLIPGMIGFYGFMQLEGVGPSWAMYYTFKLYSFTLPTMEINYYVEIARWLAPLMTAGVIIRLSSSLQKGLRNYLVSRRKGSCSVYGDGPDAKQLLQDLGKLGLSGSHRIHKTDSHVIMFEDEQQRLRFYGDHVLEFSGGKVYLALDDVPCGATKISGLHTFSMADNCASVYWGEHPALKHEKIGIIGNSGLPESILNRGLLLNILDPSQQIEYHVWSDNSEFFELHTQLNKITMDRIILCAGDEQNIILAGKLLDGLNEPKLHVRLRNGETTATFFGKDRVLAFGQSAGLANREVILQESLLTDAKQLHQHYRDLYGGEPWDSLDEFKKRSSISSAKYHSVMRRIFAEGTSKETLAELEHIRWCRFHWLNNWTLGEPDEPLKRVHHLLVDYGELDDFQKQKDREVVDLALYQEGRRE